MKKPTILFIAQPNGSSRILNSEQFQNEFNTLHYSLTTRGDFLQFLEEHVDDNIQAIYGGYPQFTPIGGLTKDLVNSRYFPRNTLKCIAICSRGFNGIDLDALLENNIQLYNYQDSRVPKEMHRDQVGNDVADCVLWHILEGFRKFSVQQTQLKADKNTLIARAHASGRGDGYAFGHELRHNGNVLTAKSPRGEKCLILGLGSIGKQIALKLQYGLGMEVHYCKTSEDPSVKKAHGWTYHALDDTLYADLHIFKAIIIALPGTSETLGLVDSVFLSHCDGPNLVLINIGRGSIVKMSDLNDALHSGRLRHFGTDVFEREPLVDDVLLKETFLTTMTPHVGSSTKDVYYQSCELALTNIVNACSSDDSASNCDELLSLRLSRVV